MGARKVRQLAVTASADDEQNLQKSGLGDGWSLEYGPGQEPTVIDPEGERVELRRHSDDVLAVMIVDRPRDAFLTCGADGTMMIWRRNGRHLSTLSGHSDRIVHLWDIGRGDILSLALDGTVRAWDRNSGKQKASIETSIESGSKLLITDAAEFLCLMEDKGVRIVTIDGQDVVVLEDQRDPPSEFRRLKSGRWLTVSTSNQRLWSPDGKILHEFTERFSQDYGFLETSGGELIVCDEQSSIRRIDANGKEIASREPDTALAKLVQRFFGDAVALENSMAERPTFEHFPHKNNPVSEPTPPYDRLQELDASEAVLEKTRAVWDFFNRPDFSAIKTALTEQIKRARSCEKGLEKAVAEDSALADQSATRRKIFGILALAAVASGVVAAGFIELVGLIAGVALGLVAANSAFKHHRTLRKARAGLAAMEPIPQETQNLITEIHRYRERIFSQLPILHSPDLYKGDEVRAMIADVTENKLRTLAMHECGVQEKDIISNDGHYQLSDGALIQQKPKSVQEKIDPHNELSFWWTAGEAIFAVQFIQFIFLTRDKIDVFLTFYDFILDRAIGKEAHAFYYKDVTNISKLDVDRSATFGSGSREIEATEIVLGVPGRDIRLTILNEQSQLAFQKLAREQSERDVYSDEERRAELLEKLNKIEKDTSITTDDREESIEMIQAQLATLDAGAVSAESPVAEKKADRAINSIRNQIRDHKQTPDQQA